MVVVYNVLQYVYFIKTYILKPWKLPKIFFYKIKIIACEVASW